MMLVGLPGLTEEEWRTHYTLWAISASPLILGNDLRKMTTAVRSILANREVIAVNQDRLGRQGRRVQKDGGIEIWIKPLSDGQSVVALFSRGDAAAMVKINWADLGFTSPPRMRDLWNKRDLTRHHEYQVTLPAHGSMLLRVEAGDSSAVS